MVGFVIGAGRELGRDELVWLQVCVTTSMCTEGPTLL